MAKKKKGPPKARDDTKKTFNTMSALGTQTGGALPGSGTPFNVDEQPKLDQGPDDSPAETLEVDAEDLGLPEEDDDIQLNDDGTATIDMDADGAIVTGDPNDFYVNLATVIPPDELDAIGERYMRLIEQDIVAREERDKQQEEGLKRAGLGGPAPGGADFEGASRVTHPVLAEAYVDFSASAMKEMFPPQGPVRTYIAGTQTEAKLEKAQRKRDYMNWQLTEEIPEYRSELESLLTQLPAGGSQFMKIYYSKDLGRTTVDFVPIDEFILPFSAKSYARTQRKFHRLKKTEFEYQQDVFAGLYVDIGMSPGPGDPMSETKSEKQTEMIEGKDSNEITDDDRYTFYEGSVWDKFDDPKRPTDRSCPYIITIDSDSHKVIGLYRNWDKNDAAKDKYEEQKYIVKFGFIPWRGAYDIGLPQLIGDLSAAMTGALRALLDSAHIQNSATAMKLKGRPSGETVSISPTQVGEVDAIGSDDIRKVIMPIQFNGPSPVLLQLLGYLTEAAKGVVSTSEEKIAEAGNQMPVGTAIALIEQGAKVFSSIHARLHHAQAECLRIIHRINRQHLKGKVMFGEDERDFVTPKDFEGPVDIIPVSDPSIFSETQRFAQLQAVMALRTQFPGKLNDDKILTRLFQLMKLPDYKDLLAQPPAPKPTNPAAENVMMGMGKPTMAFPEQDHLAHLQVHLDFLQCPLFGFNPVLAKVIIPGMLEHLKQHILFYYSDLMRLEGRTQLGQPLEELANRDKSWQTDRDISEALAKSSKTVIAAVTAATQGVPPVVAQAMQMMAKLTQPQPDPQTALAQQELAQRAAEHKDDMSIASQRLQKDTAKMMHDFQTKQDSLQMQLVKLSKMLGVQMEKAHIEASTDVAVEGIRASAEMDKTQDNNDTALEVAALKGKDSNMTDGGSMH